MEQNISLSSCRSEILRHFVIRVRTRSLLSVGPIWVAGKAWKQRKTKILREYMHNNITPFAKYLQISEE
jgi:hypothetical protein